LNLQRLKNQFISGRLARSLQQGNTTGHDYLFASDHADTFACLRLEPDLERADAKDAGDAMPDRVLVIGQFWSFRVYHAIEIHDPIASLGDFRRGRRQHIGRIATAVRGVGVGEQAANIGQGGRPEKRIGHRVQQHIGVAVPDKLSVVRHVDAADPQRPTRRRAMRVLANTDPQVARKMVSHRDDGANLNARGLYRSAEMATTQPKVGVSLREMLFPLAEREDYIPAATNSMVTATGSSAGSLRRTSICAPL
jgi:hypothetical protein